LVLAFEVLLLLLELLLFAVLAAVRLAILYINAFDKFCSTNDRDE